MSRQQLPEAELIYQPFYGEGASGVQVAIPQAVIVENPRQSRMISGESSAPQEEEVHVSREEQIRRDAELAFQLARNPDLPVARTVPAEKAPEVVILESDTAKPYFIYTILVINAIMMGVILFVNYRQTGQVISPFNENPLIGPSLETLQLLGAKDTERIVNNGEWWRLVAPMFLHAGVVHLLVNMLFIYSFGAPLERAFGCGKVAYIYLASGFTGVVFSAIFLPRSPSVGASGACYGLIGAAWADLILNCAYYKGNVIRAVVQLSFGTLLNLAIGLLPYLDNFAHIGGLLIGFFTGLSTLSRKTYDVQRQERPEKMYQLLCSLVFGFLSPILIVACLVLLFTQVDVESYCPVCKYFSCVPTPWWSCEPECNGEFKISFPQEGVNAGKAILTCPFGDIVIVRPPLPSLETLADQLGFCEKHCTD